MIVFVKRSDKTLKCVLVFIGRDGAVKLCLDKKIKNR